MEGRFVKKVSHDPAAVKFQSAFKKVCEIKGFNVHPSDDVSKHASQQWEKRKKAGQNNWNF
jgi:hypothetical protein